MTLKNLDAGPFKVGDRVTGTVASLSGLSSRLNPSLKGERATVTDRGRTWVRVQMDSRPDDVRYYLPSDLVHLDETESDLPAADAEDTDTDTKTDIRVVAVFSSLGTQKLEMVFYDAREADVWIDFLKNAPGVTTVTRDTTETFTCNND